MLADELDYMVGVDTHRDRHMTSPIHLIECREGQLQH
jgi:hypothetical protein